MRGETLRFVYSRVKEAFDSAANGTGLPLTICESHRGFCSTVCVDCVVFQPNFQKSDIMSINSTESDPSVDQLTDTATIWLPPYDPDYPVDVMHQTVQLAAICILNSLTRQCTSSEQISCLYPPSWPHVQADLALQSSSLSDVHGTVARS
jgi:hypothetical protein